MRVALYTWCVSIHQFPFSEELIKRVGVENFRYITLEKGERLSKGETKVVRNDKGWELTVRDWVLPCNDSEAQEWLENVDVLLSGVRTIDLFERRAAKGLKTYYMCERWFKPRLGVLRLLHPRYFRMTWRLFKLFKRGAVMALPCGYWAACDFVRIDGLLRGDIRCFFCSPKLKFERRAMGLISSYPWMRMWGYFTAPSASHVERADTVSRVLRVLWVGRLIRLKRVIDIVMAAKFCPDVEFDIFGSGPEESRLKHLAPPNVHFAGHISNDEVRRQMDLHDIYVLSSNAFEGWGAVINEALDANMTVFGTRECGSAATMLEDDHQYGAGNYRLLASLIRKTSQQHSNARDGDALKALSYWTPAYAAMRFYEEVSQ